MTERETREILEQLDGLFKVDEETVDEIIESEEWL